MWAVSAAPPLPVEEALQRHFGLSSFRPGQAEVIDSVLSGKNTVVVMPTGAGKSLCYQLPAMLLEGITLVISPLIALMKDQVEQLQAKGLPATFINSSLSDSERAERMRQLQSGAARILYVAPERFRSASFIEFIQRRGLALFAVDEAHCISQWGHDFRPDYQWLGRVRKLLRPPRTVALTATATPEVREDIVRTLLMKDPEVFTAGFDRPNLSLSVWPVSGDEERRESLEQIAREGGSGIVYCSTRRHAENLHRSLKSSGLKPVLYHAGLDDHARRRAQDTFMQSDRGIAVATNAFGMSIDKPDIRWVAHAQIPRAVEAYYQEIGRAGRDGKPSRAVLLFNHADVYTQERLIQGSHPSEAVVADVWDAIQAESGRFERGVPALAGSIGASEFEVDAALRILERSGKLVRGAQGAGSWTLTLLPRAAEAQPRAEDARVLLTQLRAELPLGRPLTTTLELLSRRSRLEPAAVRHAIGLLAQAEALEVHRPFTGRALEATVQLPFRELGLSLEAVREQERRALLMLRRMTDYAYVKSCRRAFLLRYFGETTGHPQRCGSCDVCTEGTSVEGLRKKKTLPMRSAAARPAHNELAELELRRWRRDLARELDVPPYIIFNDATLRELATVLPTDRESFLSVKGVGESRWERFGPKVVEISLLARDSAPVPAQVAAAPVRIRRAR